MKLTHPKLNLVFLVCIVAINAAFIAAFKAPEHFLIRLLPVLVSNILFLAAYVAVQTVVSRRNRRLQHYGRRYESLHMISEDRQVEARILETISEVSREFLDRMELRPLLDRISEAVHSLLEVDISLVEVLPEPGGDGVRFVRGAQDVNLGDEVYNEVVYRGKSLLINNLARYPQYASLAEQGILSVVLAPLTLHGRAIGLIGACTRVQRGFTSRDLRQLYSFAHHVVLLVETTQLLHSVRELSVKESDSIGDLRHLKEQLSYERRLQEREMEVARRIQGDLLPGALPKIESVVIDGDSSPAKEVGGDYYDVLDLGDGKWGIAIADVSGKGVPAALVMVMTRTLLHSLARASSRPAEILTAINDTLYHETDPSVFVSMFYGIWDARTLSLTYSNAGHEPPIILTGDGSRSLQSGGVALGAVENVAAILENADLALEENDALLLFTDGATEARNKGGEMFGQDRLEQAFKEAAAGRGDGVAAAILRSINEFAGGATQHDDITMVCIKRKHTS